MLCHLWRGISLGGWASNTLPCSLNSPIILWWNCILLLFFHVSFPFTLSAHFIHIINILHLSSSQSLMKMLNNSKPNTHPSGPTGHFLLISCITFHPSYVLWLQVSCWFWIHVTLYPFLFERISWVQIWGMFYQVLIQVQTYRELHYIQSFFP